MAILASAAVPGFGESCPPLVGTAPMHMRIAGTAPVCFTVLVKRGEAAQLATNQPIDLMLRLTGPAGKTVTDAFQFGSETLTIVEPGTYRLDVLPVEFAHIPPSLLSMSRRSISLQPAAMWQRAEITATRAKHSRTLDDIAESLTDWTQIGDTDSVARTLLKRGDALWRAESIVAARESYEQTLLLCGHDIRCRAEAANNSGAASFMLGDFEGAWTRLRDADAYWRRLKMIHFEGRTLSTLGLVYWQTGDYEKAIEMLNRARSILLRREGIAYALVMNNLGVTYQSLQENEKAASCFSVALAIFAKRHDLHDAVYAHDNLGRSWMLLGKLHAAEQALTTALSEASPYDAARADVLNNLGQVLLREHREQEARARLEQSLVLQRKVNSKVGESTALHYLGVEAAAKGETDAARRLLIEALRIRREAGLRDDASESAFALADLEYRSGDLAQARDLLNEAIRLIESLRGQTPGGALRASYYARKRRFFDLLVEIAMKSDSQEASARALLASEQERGRAVLDLISEGAIRRAAPAELLRRQADLRRRISVCSQRLAAAEPAGATPKELAQQLELLLTDEDQVENGIREAVHGSALGLPLASVPQLQRALPVDSALLEYYLGESASYLWLVTPRELRCFRLPPRAEMERLALRTADQFGDIVQRLRSPRAQTEFAAGLRNLANTLLGPLTGVSLPPRLILVLDGALNRVPFAALRPSWAHEPVGLAHDLIRAPSAAYLLAAKPPKPVPAYAHAALAIADPVFAPDDPRVNIVRPVIGATGLARLPFTLDITELQTVLRADDVQVLRGFDATPHALYRARLQDFAVIHFSTHAFIDDRMPELSRIALSLVDRNGRPVDGYLRAPQFADFRLDRSIVALSSCETALGKEELGEGMIGFADSLFSAGASQLVLSLAKVDAEPSAAFFAEAYRSYFRGRRSGIEHALTVARRALARSERWSDPYYWAPFTVIGAPGS